MEEAEAKKVLENIIEVQCKKFWLWCFLHKAAIEGLTGFYNINERADKIYKLYKSETNES